MSAMAEGAASLSFDTDFDPRTGEAVDVAPSIVRVTAPNGGPFTFKGTNTFILGSGRVAVVDPGPDDDRHLAALKAAIGSRPVEAIILTHTHRDHCALVPRLMAETGAPLWFAGMPDEGKRRRHPFAAAVDGAGDRNLVPDRRLADGERLSAGGLEIEVVATPGHSANHLCFGVSGTPDLLSGDHVMGWSSSVIALPDGSLGDYLASLAKLAALPYRRYLPAHGGPIADGPSFARSLRMHRELRNRQVMQAIAEGARSIGALQRRIYPRLALALLPAARMTLGAHVEYLAAEGRIAMRRGLLGPVLSPSG